MARYEYVNALLKRHKHSRARQEIEKLLLINPDNRNYQITRASICVGMGDLMTAIPVYKKAIQDTSWNAELHMSLAHAMKTLGDTVEAVESYRAAVASRPSFGEAYWSMANLKTYCFTESELSCMLSEENNRKAQLTDRYHLCFALGKAFEDRADYERSFTYYERGNNLKNAECRYNPETIEGTVSALTSFCTQTFFQERHGFGSNDTSPIFIVGLPRSGSTLIEQILASHSQVEGTMELADIPRLAQDLQGRGEAPEAQRYTSALGTLLADDCLHRGEQYIADTQAYRMGKRYFIDKMPNNWRHIGLIRLILPHARIIDARRDSIACCFSNFKQLFASGQEFTYSFDNIARYHRSYIRLMAHWDDVMPSHILRVQHEVLVNDFDSTVQRILDFCGLPFEQNCLNFYNTERRIHTASSEQVRRPIDRKGLEQWRHYEKWLWPLRERLEFASSEF